MSRAVIKRRVLPDAPNPTKPQYVNNVQGIRPEHLEVRPYRPPVILDGRPKKHKKPTRAIEESVRRKVEAREKRKAETIRMWRDGVPLQEIADKLGVKLGTVQDYTRDLRAVGYNAELTKYDDDLIRMFNEGKTYGAMAEALGITKSAVACKLQRLCKLGKIRRRKSWSVENRKPRSS